MWPRYWLSPVQDGKNGVLVTRTDATSPIVAKALIGLSADELRYRTDLARLLAADPQTFADTVWLSEVLAAKLGVKAGDQIVVQGQRLTVGKLLDPVRLSVLRDMDDSRFLPVDFEEQSSVAKNAQAPSSAEAMAAVDGRVLADRGRGRLPDHGGRPRPWPGRSPARCHGLHR